MGWKCGEKFSRLKLVCGGRGELVDRIGTIGFAGVSEMCA